MFINKIIQTLLKKSCLICGTNDFDSICHGCQSYLPILPQVCPQCAEISPSKGAVCATCLASPPLFSITHALFPYEFPIIEFVRRLKFQGQLMYAATFGAMMIKAITQSWYIGKKLPDLIIPIPLHAKRLRVRGFNQALEIARPIARHFKIPLIATQILRSKATQAQTLLKTAEQRQENLLGAFQSKLDLKGKHVVIVDDVITTGQTIGTFCQELNRAGAGQIDIWCCAKVLSIHTEVAQSLKTR